MIIFESSHSFSPDQILILIMSLSASILTLFAASALLPASVNGQRSANYNIRYPRLKEPHQLMKRVLPVVRPKSIDRDAETMLLREVTIWTLVWIGVGCPQAYKFLTK